LDDEHPGRPVVTASHPQPSKEAPGPTLTPEEQQALAWREIYDRRDPVSVVQQYRLALALEWIDSLGLEPGETVLDAGCGSGIPTIELARRGGRVTAVDVSPAMLVDTRWMADEAAYSDRVRTCVGDVQALPFGDGTFGLVVALGLVPWAERPLRALAEMHRVLRPGGFAVVSATNRWSLVRVLDPHPLRNPLLAPIGKFVRDLWPSRRNRGPGEAITVHGTREFDRLLTGTGFESVQARTYGFGPFTMFQRPLLPDRQAIALHAWLQRLADRGVTGLRTMGTQYLVLCRRRA